MPDYRRTTEAIAVLTHGLAEYRKRQTEMKISNTASFARIMEMMEEMRAEMRSEIRQLKVHETRAEKQPVHQSTPSEHHEIVSSSTEPKLISEDEMKTASIVDGDDSVGVDFDLDIYSELVLAKLPDVVEEEINFSHLINDSSSESEVVEWKETLGFAKSICVSNCNLSICSHGVCQNASMDYSSYFMMRTNSDSYILVPEMKADDLSVLLRNMNDFNEVESSLVCRLQLRTWINGVQRCLYVKLVDGNFVYDKGKSHMYDNEWQEAGVEGNMTVRMDAVTYNSVLAALNKYEMLSYSLPNRKPPRLPPANVLKIDMLDDDVAELEKGEDSLLESMARLDSHMLSVGQIVVQYGDHAEFIQVRLKPPRDILLHGLADETRRINLIHVGICLPSLVYVSPDKRPSYDLHKKAKAVNTSVHVSASMANVPFILNLDCHHYIYNSQAKEGNPACCSCCFVHFKKNVAVRHSAEGNRALRIGDSDDEGMNLSLLPERFGNLIVLLDSIPVAVYQDHYLGDHLLGAHLAAVLQVFLKVVAVIEIFFTLTSTKCGEDADDEFADLNIVKRASLVNPPVTLMTVNFIVVVVKVSKKIYRILSEWSKLIGRVLSEEKFRVKIDDVLPVYKQGDQSKHIHVLKLSLDRLKGLVMLAFETAFFILDFSLVDPVFQVCCVNKFYIFSSPRPPEVADLEDKVNFKDGGMLRNGILGNLGGLLVIWYNLDMYKTKCKPGNKQAMK